VIDLTGLDQLMNQGLGACRALYNTKLEKEMNVYQLLKQDHKTVAGIFAKLEPTTERALKTREELFSKLNSELEVHTAIEEKIFYPVLKEAAETRDITFEAFEEHRVVKELLKELSTEPKDTEEWTAKLTVLKENVEHHVEEEEGEMFKKARKVLTDAQAEELGARMEAAKTKLAATAR
jgi:iron-sulfur cluster repair protein YtfE (RIC family)